MNLPRLLPKTWILLIAPLASLHGISSLPSPESRIPEARKNPVGRRGQRVVRIYEGLRGLDGKESKGHRCRN